MRVFQIKSIHELRSVAPAWDDLWLRSELALPTLCADFLALWLEKFADGKRFLATVVERDGQLIAALPLVETTKAGLLRIGRLPANSWSSSGDLLLDPECSDEALSLLADSVRKLPWTAIMLDQVEIQSDRWQRFADALARAGLPTATDPQFHVGLVDIDHDWKGYQESWSSNHRHAVLKSKRKLEQQGDTQLVQYDSFDGDMVERLLRTAFEIEDLSWKGEAGTSIQRTPGMFEFFVEQARQLADRGQLELLFLEHCGKPIAFEYCYVAKGVTFSHKIGYDPSFQKFGPGRLLRLLQLEDYFQDESRRLFDTLGILCESKAKWCTRSYELGRLTVGTGNLASSTFMQAYTRIWPHIRKLRGTSQPLTPPKLGAVREPDLAEAMMV